MGNQRTAYGDTLVELGKKYGDIVACEADLGKSTMSCLFQEAYPERYFEMGIGEQNMVSFAAGLSFAGKVPFIHTFSAFLVGRAYEQIRVSICLGKKNVKVIGSSYGLSDYGDGATHQSFEDISLLRSLPNMTILTPVDAYETKKLTEAAYALEGPVYLRINRNDMPELYNGDEKIEIGKPVVMREGKDAVVFAHGIMVSKALEAAKLLYEKGIDVKVVNVNTIKAAGMESLKNYLGSAKAVIAAEEHTIFNGLGSLIEHELRGTDIPVELVGIEDRFGQSAENYDVLLVEYGLTAERIAGKITQMLK